jgi:gluconolactonase
VHNIWQVRSVRDSLDHPECVAFGPSGRLYAGGEAGQVYQIDPDGGTCEVIASTGGFVLGIAVDADENLYVCDMKKHNLVRVNSDRTVTTILDRVEGDPLLSPNFCVFHPDGDLFLTDSGDYWHSNGRLIRVHPDGTSDSLLGGRLNFPNGLALSADAKTLYMIESTSAKISRMTFEGDGLHNEPETYVQLPGSVPDGMAFDLFNNLYRGCYAPDIIFRVDSERNVTTLIEDRTGEVLSRPSNVAFRPEKPTELYFANVGGWHIGCLDIGSPGRPLNYPRIR